MNLAQAVQQIKQAKTPADLFPDPDLAVAAYRRLARLVHPDVNPDTDAGATFKRLTELWWEHNNPEPGPIRGDIANLFRRDGGCLKMPRDPRDNDLMEREAKALKRLREHRPDTVFSPRLLATGRQRDPATRIVRRVNTLEPLDGYVSLAQVIDAYPDGLHPRDIAWIWRRVLTCAGVAHLAGIVHGAILPPHIMLHPESHRLMLVDWCYATPTGSGPLPALVTRYADLYDAKVRAKQPATEQSDVYAATQTMLLLMRPAAPEPFLRFAAGCMLGGKMPHALALVDELDDLLRRIFGPPRFHHFAMPATP